MMFDYRKTSAGKRRFSNPRLYRLTYRFQNLLWKAGFAIHNPFSDECTRDFNCCNEGLGRFAFLRLGK